MNNKQGFNKFFMVFKDFFYFDFFSPSVPDFREFQGFLNIISQYIAKIGPRQKKRKNRVPKFCFYIFQKFSWFSYFIPIFVFLTSFLDEIRGEAFKTPPAFPELKNSPPAIGLIWFQVTFCKFSKFLKSIKRT